MSNAKEQEKKTYSILDYLEMEKKATEKNEYHNGTILAMSGGSIPHGIIGGNIVTHLNLGIANHEKKCLSTNSEVKVFIEKANSFVYPDAMVICGDIESPENDKNAVINPIIIIEVLSDSTSSYDRGDKFHMYCSLPSFKEYILIDQKKPVVDSLFREDNSYWRMTTTIGLNKSFPIHTLGFDIQMADLYKNVPNLKNPQINLDL